MFKSKLELVAITAAICFAAAGALHAQEAPQDISVAAEILAEKPKAPRIKRIEQPIPYWVEADQLRVRDNPYAGDVIGMLEVGQKVQVRKTIDDWGLISAADKPEQWVNRNFLSPSPVTWASYNFDSRSARTLKTSRFSDARYDIKKKRIKVKELKGVRVYAADIKRLANDQKIVISRHDYRAGPYFEKRLVKCDAAKPSHIKMLGEGYTVMMMEADPRGERVGIPMTEADRLAGEETGVMENAIAEFACKTDKL